jgi:hypothetical protein
VNKFLLVKAGNRDSYEAAKAKLRERALDLLPFHPDRIRIREFEQSLVLFANFEITETGGFAKHHVATTDDATFAFDGLPYSQALDPAKNWAKQLDASWRDDQKIIEETYGTWAFARFHRHLGGAVISDFSGMTPLFYWHDKDYLAISPRQMLLSGICGDLEYDIERMAWLTGQANLIGDAAVWKNVRHLPPQWTLSFSARPSDLTFQVQRREIWSSEIDETPDEARVAFICESMLAQCEVLSRLPLPPLRIDITGGLDSRLVAALANASSLRHRIECLQTSGTEDDAEVQVGKSVAAALGLRHLVKLPAPSSVTPDGVLDGIRASAFRYEASICPSDGFVGTSRKSHLVLTGSAGEIYRRHCKPHMGVHLGSRDELHSLFSDYHQKTDPLGIQKPWLTLQQQRSMQELATGYHGAGVALNDVTDVFFMRYRLPLWNGIMMNNIFGAARAYPLVNYFAAKYAFSKGYRARVGDRIHFELMLKVNPGLCAMPFLKFAWPPEYRAHAARAGVAVAASPYPVTAAAGRKAAVSRAATMMGEGWDLARAYLLDRKDSDLWQVIDRPRVEQVFRDGSSGFRGVVPGKQIFSLLGMQAALCGDALRRPDGALEEPRLDGTAANRIFRRQDS